MCKNHLKFGHFENYFWVSPSFQLSGLTFVPLHLWVLRHFLPEVFPDRIGFFVCNCLRSPASLLCFTHENFLKKFWKRKCIKELHPGSIMEVQLFCETLAFTFLGLLNTQFLDSCWTVRIPVRNCLRSAASPVFELNFHSLQRHQFHPSNQSSDSGTY